MAASQIGWKDVPVPDVPCTVTVNCVTLHLIVSSLQLCPVRVNPDIGCTTQMRDPIGRERVT